MSPGRNPLPTRPASFPRVSGDEPDTLGLHTPLFEFSPRERG